MRGSYREKLIALVTFIAGLYFFLEFALPKKIGEFQFGAYHDQISNGFIVVGVMAIGLGLINLLRVHGTAILRGRKSWPYSTALLLGLGIMMYFEIAAFVQAERGVYSWQRVAQFQAYAEKILAERKEIETTRRISAGLEAIDGFIAETANPETSWYSEDEGQQAAIRNTLATMRAEFERFGQVLANDTSAELQMPATLTSSIVAARTAVQEATNARLDSSAAKRGASFLYNGFFVPLGAAMFSLLAFYVATAAYRTFRIRSVEAGIMMLAALIVMLGQIPQGPTLISPHLVPLRLWLLEQLSTPAFRAIYFGSAIAGLAMAVRMWLSLERSPLESDQ